MRILFALALLAGPAWADDCPDPLDHGAEQNNLLAAARAAPSEAAERTMSDEMWKVWLRAPNDQAQEILDRGMRRRDRYDFAGAFQEFDRLANTVQPTLKGSINVLTCNSFKVILQGRWWTLMRHWS